MALFYVFFAEGFEEIEAIGTVDILRRAGIDVLSVGAGSKDITGAHGITVKTDLCTCELDESKDFDGIILPGGMPGTVNLEKNEKVQAMIRKAEAEDKYLCAICAAPSVLGHMGCLEGKKATCYPGFEPELYNAIPSPGSVVTDAKTITSRGPGTMFDFALKIVQTVAGEKTQEDLKRGMLYRE